MMPYSVIYVIEDVLDSNEKPLRKNSSGINGAGDEMDR